MPGSPWFKRAVLLLAEKGRIEVNVVPNDLRSFKQEYKRLVGTPPQPSSFNVASNPSKKGGSELRLILDSEDAEDVRIVEMGLRIELRRGSGGKSYRKGSRRLCMKLIASGLDIGGRPPHRRLASEEEIRADVERLANNARRYLEGFRKEITREVNSRNAGVLEAAKREKGYVCVVCGFDFFEFYGPHGEGFIEGHHRDPVSTYTGVRTVTVEDIDLVCANCHRMLHRGERLLTVEELKGIITRDGSRNKWPWELDS